MPILRCIFLRKSVNPYLLLSTMRRGAISVTFPAREAYSRSWRMRIFCMVRCNRSLRSLGNRNDSPECVDLPQLLRYKWHLLLSMVMSLSNKCGWICSMKNRFLLKILMLVFPSSVRSLLLIVRICMIVSWKSNHLAFNWKNVDLLWRFCHTGKGYRLRGLIANGWIRISRWLMLCQKPFTMRPFWKFVKEKKCLCFSTRPFSAPRRREPSEENPSSLLPMLSLKTRCQGKKKTFDECWFETCLVALTYLSESHPYLFDSDAVRRSTVFGDGTRKIVRCNGCGVSPISFWLHCSLFRHRPVLGYLLLRCQC